MGEKDKKIKINPGLSPGLTMKTDTVLGFFDADGSFEAKVYHGTTKPLGFHVNAIFSQENSDALEVVINSIGATNARRKNKRKTISSRVIQNASGTQSVGRSISLAFSSPGGKTLLQAWEADPPKAPTKYQDYRIAKVLAEMSETTTTTASSVVKKHLPNNPISSCCSERIAGLGLLWLRYRMHGKTKKSKHPKLRPIESHYEEMGATQSEIAQGVEIGQWLFEPIQRDIAQYVINLKSSTLSDDYMLGYHIGDGSFSIYSTIKSKSFKAGFHWTLTDCLENEPLLEAVKNTLKTKGFGKIGMHNYGTFVKLQLSGINSGRKIVSLWENIDLPQVRQNQYNCFSQALTTYTAVGFRKDLKQLEEFINLMWQMNLATNKKRKSTLADDLAKIKFYFDNTQ